MACLLAMQGAATALPPADEAWLEADVTDTSHVNEGVLEVFEAPPPGGPFHHHRNQLTLLPTSLETGWVHVEQCHRHLDSVLRLEVTFRPGGVRGLEVVEARNIAAARVEGHSVQLRDVGADALLCLRGELRMIAADGAGRYVLRSGPYMRRFLDGYYPMRVDVEIDLAQAGVRVGRVSPTAQPGLEVVRGDGSLRIGALFAGRLLLELELLSEAR